MNPGNPTPEHPANEELAAFALGKKTPNADTIAEHVAGCARCETFIVSTPRDTFLNILDTAKPGSSGDGPRAPAPPATGPDELPDDLRRQTKYTFLKKLGGGGMGVVYLAEHNLMKRKVAVKLIPPEMIGNPLVRERFLREVISAAALEHPNVVRAYSAEEFGQSMAFEMEFVDGKDLGQVIKKKGPLPVAHAANYIRQAAKALQYGMQKSLVHRDIKPGNLMLTRSGDVKVADFGLAKFSRESDKDRDRSLTGANTIMGTPDYMAPEQARNAKGADIRADIYSLGCTFHYLLTGQPPFTGDSITDLLFKHWEAPRPDVRSLRDDVPPELSQFIQKMMAKQPGDRPQAPKEVVDYLLQFVKPGAVAPVVPKPAPAQPASAAASASIHVGGGWAQYQEGARPATPPLGSPRASPFAATPLPLPANTPLPLDEAESNPAFLPTITSEPEMPHRPSRKKQRPVWVLPAVAIAAPVVLLIVLAAGGAFKDTNSATKHDESNAGTTSPPTPSARSTPAATKITQQKVKPADGTISLENLPADAQVMMGGQPVLVAADGKISVTPGKKYRVEVKKDGFMPFMREVEAGETVVVRLLPLKSRDRAIVLENLPADAKVTIDGDPAAISRNGSMSAITVTADKKHRLEVDADGFETFRRDIDVGEQRVIVRLKLTRPQEVELEDFPKDAVIKVDEVEVHVDRQSAQPRILLDQPGHHTIKVKDGTKVFESDVTVRKDGAPIAVRILMPGKEAEVGIATGVKMKFCWVPPGTAQLGSPRPEQDYVTNKFFKGRRPSWLDNEAEDKRGLFKADGFWLGKYTVTQEEWSAVMKEDSGRPSYFSKEGSGGFKLKNLNDTSRLPREWISLEQIHEFLNRLNAIKKEKIPQALGNGKFALPTENEWEYACRGGLGNGRPFYFGDKLNGDQANCNGREHPYGTTPSAYVEQTMEVGHYKSMPHPWGLCDMHGNVWQWCENKTDDPNGFRVLRGGAWDTAPQYCRAAYRNRDRQDEFSRSNGFRVIYKP